MTESQIQELLQNQTQSTLPDTTGIFTSMLEPLMPILSILATVGVVLSVVIVLYFIINIIQKQRQHKAILRIDRNLQKLVDAQVPAPVQQPKPGVASE